MRKILLALLTGVFLSSPMFSEENEPLSASTLPEFLKRYEQSLEPVDQAYLELTNENLPLQDESGQPLGRHRIEDRRQLVTDLRQTVRELTGSPQDLVLTAKLLVQTEALVDDLFDVAEVCYDNDREELGKRLADLETTMDHNRDVIEKYTLVLAAAKEAQIENLEKQNQELQQKLKEATERHKASTSRDKARLR